MRESIKATLYGAPVGALGGLIGLGGAEFRLPVLKAVFGRPTHQAIPLNLAVSLVTLAASMAIRLYTTGTTGIGESVPVLLGFIGGSMSGAYLGAAVAGRLPPARLEGAILVLLVAIGLVLILEGLVPLQGGRLVEGALLRPAVAAVLGIGIGVVSSLLGVAGGELIIPSLVLVFGADIKLAGTLSVLISLPTVSVGIWRYARRGAYARSDLGGLVLPMGLGSIVGAMLGGLAVPFVPAGLLKLGLGFILIVSAARIFRHGQAVSAVTAPVTAERGPGASAQAPVAKSRTPP